VAREGGCWSNHKTSAHTTAHDVVLVRPHPCFKATKAAAIMDELVGRVADVRAIGT
jgi:hypothetical protein